MCTKCDVFLAATPDDEVKRQVVLLARSIEGFMLCIEPSCIGVTSLLALARGLQKAVERVAELEGKPDMISPKMIEFSERIASEASELFAAKALQHKGKAEADAMKIISDFVDSVVRKARGLH